ncbi:MAG: acyl carrier protein [Sandaracinaceae bacterium]|nr:acyl carrier protein [Sandaracinaceae bacterium]
MLETPDGRRSRTIELIAEILEVQVDTVRPPQRLREDLGLDSLQSLELLSLLGEELRLELPMEEALELETVEDACAFVERTVAANA